MNQSYSAPIDDELLRVTLYLPGKLNKCVYLLANDYLKDTRIKPYYLPYIFHIRYNEGLSQSDLQKFIPFDKSRISVVVHELMDEGLVYNSATGRNSRLHLTEEGITCFCVCKMFMELVKKELFNLTPEEEEIHRNFQMKLDRRLSEILAKHSKV